MLVAGTFGNFALSCDVRLWNLVVRYYCLRTRHMIFIVFRCLGSLPIFLRTSVGAAISLPKMVGSFANTVFAV